MTEEEAAIKLAIELLHMPSRVRGARAQPLPPGLPKLLQIAAGDEGAALAIAQALERSKEVVLEAARFYIEQVLLAPDADCYRMLGAHETASTADLRRNMALLLRSLHPDVTHTERSIFAQRITGAWDQLKTPERRALYDHKRDDEVPGRQPRNRKIKPRFVRRGLRETVASVLARNKP